MTLYDAASRYAELGYRVFPLAPRSKKPTGGSNGLTDATSDVDQVERWWNENPTYNIGISTDGLIVIDPDLIDKESSNPKPNPWLTDDIARALAIAPNQKTWSGGRQYIFRQPDGRHYRNTTSAIAANTDTRGFGGYIAIAPSFVKGETGNRSGYYQFAPGCELEVEPEYLPEPPDWLIAELDRIEANRGKVNGKPSDGKAAGTIGSQIPDGRRDGTLASMAGTMRRKGFDQSAIEAALLATNEARCKPPLPEADIKRIAGSVARYEPGDPAIEQAGQPDVTYQRITAAELDSGSFELSYLIDDVLPAMQPQIGAGAKKTLKTSLYLDLGISAASGLPFLGKFKVDHACRVAMMSGESGLATLQETARRISRAKGIELRDVSNLIVSPDLPRIGDARHDVALEQFLVADEIELLIADPAYLMLDGEDAGNLMKMGTRLRSISGLCQRVGVTLCLLHHTKKNVDDAFRPAELEDLSWSAFPEFARSWVLMSRRKPYEPGTGHHELWLNMGGSAGHSSLWAMNIDEGTPKDAGGRRWDVEVVSAADAREQAAEQQEQTKSAERERKYNAKVEAAKTAIADALRGVDGHADTKRGIRERSGVQGTALDTAMAYLIRVNKLTPCEVERENGHKYEGYRYEFGERA